MEPSIFDVCRTGNLELLKTMDIPDINVRDIFGMTPLSIAILHGRLEIAKYILSLSSISFPSTSFPSKDGKAGSKSLNVNVKNDAGYTALHEACRASREGYLEIIKLLINHGADINAQSASGLTPLDVLIAYSHGCECEKIAQYLISSPSLDKRADVNIQNKNGWTSLFYAARGEREDIIHHLLEQGADPSIKSKKGEYAFEMTNNEKIIKILKDAIQEQNIPDIKGAL